MNFVTAINQFSRAPITIIEIDQDYCNNIFGVSPCMATGTKCYNTYASCKNNVNYSKGIKAYKYCDYDVVPPFDFVRPYFKNIADIPTELREDKTIPRRVSLQFVDEPDTDIDTDPYWSSRGYSSLNSVKGTYWKRFLARNPNYKGRMVIVKEGFAGMAETDYQVVFTGMMDTIAYDKNTLTLSCIDLLKALDQIIYPLQVQSCLAQYIGQVYKASSDSAMYALSAFTNDYCLRTDYIQITGVAINTFNGGTMPTRDYFYYVVAFDNMGYPIAITQQLDIFVDNSAGKNDVSINWDAVTLASYYRVYMGLDRNLENVYVQVTTNYFWQYNLTDISTAGIPPEQAIRYFMLTQYGWSWTTFAITLTDASMLPASGYISIDSEIIYYSSRSSTVLSGVLRGLYNTSMDFHTLNTQISVVLQINAGNPFQILLNILALAGISNTYIDVTTINNYKNAYTGINFSAAPILSDKSLGEVYFDLINMLDARSWINENSQITIKLNSDPITPIRQLTDDMNIVSGSISIDRKESSRYTRMAIYWMNIDPTQSSGTAIAYRRENISIDSNAESVNQYGDVILKEYFTSFINEDCGNLTTIANYVNSILSQKLSRYRDAAPYYSFDLDLKDSDLFVGDYVGVSSDDFCYSDGSPFNQEIFQIVKREKKVSNKYTFTCEHINLVPLFGLATLIPSVNASSVQSSSPAAPQYIYITQSNANSLPIKSSNVPHTIIIGIIISGNKLETIDVTVTTKFDAGNTLSFSDAAGAIPSSTIKLDFLGTVTIRVYKRYAANTNINAIFAGTVTAGTGVGEITLKGIN